MFLVFWFRGRGGAKASPKSSPEGKDLALKTNKMPE